MNTLIEIQMEQNRLNLIEQEILCVQREINDQEAIEADCEENERRSGNRVYYGATASQEQLLELKKRHNTALKKHLKLNEHLRRLYNEKSQIISRLRSYDDSMPLQAVQLQAIQPVMTNLYSETEGTTVMHDVFISHATEDKESFVNDFVAELTKRNVKVWVDELKIQWGDSLRKSIDEGLKKSRFGVVVISRHFIAKGWTQYELDGLFEKEMSGGKVILPIWHNITRKEVQAFSPTLAGRKAMTTASMTPADIASELVVLLKEERR